VIPQEFFREAMKLAGVGFDLHGYHRDPRDVEIDEDDKKYEKWFQRRTKEVARPTRKPIKRFGFFGRTTGHQRVSKEEQAAFQARRTEWEAKNPPPPMGVDKYDYVRDSRVKTPFDRSTNYKLNLNAIVNSAPQILDQTTDFSYSGKPMESRLSKTQLRGILKTYADSGEQYAKAHPDDPHVRPGLTAFQGKAKALLKDPKVKFVRLEWE